MEGSKSMGRQVLQLEMENLESSSLMWSKQV